MALRGRSPEQRDAELQAQKEMLERRRNEKETAKYMESVAARRADAEAFFQSNQLDIQPGEDPLEAWKRKEARGLIKPIGYEDVPEGGIPLPAASFGIPKYDNGERTCPEGSSFWQPNLCWCSGDPLFSLDWSATRALSVLGVFWVLSTGLTCACVLFSHCRRLSSLTRLYHVIGLSCTAALVPVRI